jgi:hypothetical protein
MNAIGKIPQPSALASFGTVEGGALGGVLNLFLRLLIVIAGIYALFNFVLAGYAFMSAGDDPKKMQAAWGKIWQTVLGLTFSAGAFALSAIIGKLVFDNWNFLLQPTIPTL